MINALMITDDVSLPTRERGLKFKNNKATVNTIVSLPTRERGLKYIVYPSAFWERRVAPCAGAWIEILCGVVPTVSQTSRSLCGSVD